MHNNWIEQLIVNHSHATTIFLVEPLTFKYNLDFLEKHDTASICVPTLDLHESLHLKAQSALIIIFIQ